MLPPPIMLPLVATLTALAGLALGWLAGVRRPALLVVGLVCCGAGLAIGWWLAGAGLVAAAVFTPFAVVASAIDLREHRLPNRLTATAVAALIGVHVTAAVLSGQWMPVLSALVAGAACGMALATLSLVSSLGMGDAKLAISLGLLWGWHGWATVVAGITVVALAGFVAAVTLLLAGRRGTDHLAFGPFLALGAIAVLL